MNAISPRDAVPPAAPDDLFARTAREREFILLIRGMTTEGGKAFCDAIIAQAAGGDPVPHLRRCGRAEGRTEAEIEAVVAQHQGALA